MTDQVQVEVFVEQEGKTASRARTGDHALVMDRPVAKGGENLGPMGGQVLLMGLGGCFMSNLLAAAQARDTVLTGVSLNISGTLEGPPTRFTAIDVEVGIPGLSADQAGKLVTIAERACIVANTLKPSVALSIRAV